MNLDFQKRMIKLKKNIRYFSIFFFIHTSHENEIDPKNSIDDNEMIYL